MLFELHSFPVNCCIFSSFISCPQFAITFQREWSQPQIQGDLVAPRAGHAGITIDENWYIVGGGDNKNGIYNYCLLNLVMKLCAP